MADDDVHPLILVVDDAADTFLAKPCLPPIVLAKIREMLRL